MDKLGSKKRLCAGLGDFARRRRMEEMRKKYSAAPPEMAAHMESEDETIENASLPSVGMKVDKMEDVNNDDFEKAMSEFASDEEDARWMAKQRG